MSSQSNLHRDVRTSDISSLRQRRQERELFFWTARQTLALILLTACTLGAVVAIANGGMEIMVRAVSALLR